MNISYTSFKPKGRNLILKPPLQTDPNGGFGMKQRITVFYDLVPPSIEGMIIF